MTSAIETEALTKNFWRVEALRNISVEVPAQAIYSLVGPNGAGKTTLIKVLMNIIRPSAGRATVMGRPSTSIAGREFTAIGYVSENQELPAWMRVDRFLNYFAGFYPAWDRLRANELIKQFDLPLARKLKHLSRGMRMKTALASALASHPKLIMLDEPFSGLDPLVRDQLIESLLEHASEATIFVSSHDLAEIESFSTHVGYLEQGTLRFSEELSSLNYRFREVEVLRGHEAPIPSNLPRSWLQVSDSSRVVRFVETRFDSDRTNAEIRSAFSDVREVTFTPMSLRSIFLAVAKHAGSVQQ
jgi:ABC-2 type transport system ATP-binding protein